MSKPIHIALLIVSWNARKYLKICLDSIYQSRCEVEFSVWVIDNQSDDNSADMVASDYPQVELIRSGGNLGFAGGNNIGLDQIQAQQTADYVCLVNSDVKVRHGWLDDLLSYMQDHPKVGLSGCRIENADHSLQRSCMHSPHYWNVFCRSLALDSWFPNSRFFDGGLMQYWAHDRTQTVDVLFGCLWMARQSALQQVGGLDTDFFMYAEDLDWCLRFRQAGWQVMYYPDTAVIHYGGGSSSNAPIRFYQEEKRSLLFYWRKHHGILGLTYMYIMSLVHESLRLLQYGLLSLLRRQNENFRYKRQRSVKTLLWLLNIPSLYLKAKK